MCDECHTYVLSLRGAAPSVVHDVPLSIDCEYDTQVGGYPLWDDESTTCGDDPSEAPTQRLSLAELIARQATKVG